MRCHGIVVADRGAAIVSVERDEDDALLVTGIERLRFDLAAVTERVRALADPEARHVIDAEGLGPRCGPSWAAPRTLITGSSTRGAGSSARRSSTSSSWRYRRHRFHFAPGLEEQEAMSRALLHYRRQVREDGLIGSELVVALLLALIPPPVWVPMVAFR